ncbi:MAG: histidinol-phosphatase [Acidobacteria bacterium]|nr:histidinol-phosphatase [Acidobacteriota bacterium]
MLDYHLHLWEHGQRSLDATLEQVAAYCEHAQAEGVTEIALTEHFYRFRQAEVLRGWWDEDEADQGLRSGMRQYWDDEQGGDLDRYVEVALAAKAAGLPVVVGLEVDYFRGRMDIVERLLAGYPFDVLLGSVHWLGAWGFDNNAVPAFAAEWEARKVEAVWDDYTTSLEELAASGTCDVLAHPDLCKVFGHVPGAPDEFYDRMAEAAASSGMAAEVSSAGWRKPIDEAYPAPPLLERFKARGVPVTTASDAHRLAIVADRRTDVRSLLTAAGYTSLRAYAARTPRDVDI